MQGHVLVCDVVHLYHFSASKIDWYTCSVFMCDVVLQFCFDACLSGGYVLYTCLVFFI